jgi:integrase/recombinase XerC
MVLLGAHAGLRIGEMAELCWPDIDWRNQLIYVQNGKGGKAGRVRMSGRLQDALGELRSVPDKRYDKRRVRPYVLPWGQGHARKRFRELCTLAGIAYEVKGVHGLRHGAGSRYYAQVKDLGRVAAHLRHADIQTTRIYAKIDEMTIGEDIDDW